MKYCCIVIIAGTLITAAVALADGLPARHPSYVELGDRKPVCSDCHEDENEPILFKRYNHTPLFLEEHKRLARTRPDVCELCHRQASCQDCHATRTELKPSVKRQVQTYKRSPHRGDYLSRHRLQARIDPARCYRCHGNPRRSASCRRCH